LECKDYADMSKYLAEDAKIIDFQKFESGVRKIMAGEALDPQEAIASLCEAQGTSTSQKW